MSSDGYVITNHHVITGALVISVLTNDNQEFEAALVGSDEMSDLAVLKIDARGLQAAEFGDSSKLRVGDSVVAIGDPLGVQLRGTMTNGIISAINRDLTVGDRTMTLIQPDYHCFCEIWSVKRRREVSAVVVLFANIVVSGIIFTFTVYTDKISI